MLVIADIIVMLVPVRSLVRQYRLPVSCIRTAALNQAAAAAPAAAAVKWDIVAAVCVERPPYLTPAMSDIQQKTVDMLKLKEYEESMLNDHELRHK